MSRKHRLDQRKLCVNEALVFYGTFRLKTETNVFLADINTVPLTPIVNFSVSISLNEMINVPFSLVL